MIYDAGLAHTAPPAIVHRTQMMKHSIKRAVYFAIISIICVYTYMRVFTFVISFHPIPILLCSISIKCLFKSAFFSFFSFIRKCVCVCCSLISDKIQSEQIGWGWKMRFHIVDMCDWKWFCRCWMVLFFGCRLNISYSNRRITIKYHSFFRLSAQTNFIVETVSLVFFFFTFDTLTTAKSASHTHIHIAPPNNRMRDKGSYNDRNSGLLLINSISIPNQSRI